MALLLAEGWISEEAIGDLNVVRLARRDEFAEANEFSAGVIDGIRRKTHSDDRFARTHRFKDRVRARVWEGREVDVHGVHQ